MTAHQSLRRNIVEQVPRTVEDASSQQPFRYRPLNPEVDGTRFVKILPATADDDILRCELLEIPFKDRPAYEALSYTWGNVGKTQRIEVDGGFLDIGQNLFDALCFLRKRQRGGLYWVDALCIHQDDVAERNRQLDMMGQIYFRSSTVLVWLGARYLKYQDKLSESHIKTTEPGTSNLSTSSEREENGDSSHVDMIEYPEQREMVKELCTDPYWKRVWIIQEIGQARRLIVCFGSFEIGWDDFIHLITMHHKDGGGPMRLHSLRQERDHGGYPLTTLLRDHREAECKETKDKIYGLVGLAGDAHGFPMDYDKNLIQIWTDTMEFVNRRRLVQDTDFINFGGLVKLLLMGAQCDPWSQIERPNADDDGQQSGIIDDSMTPNSSKVFGMKASAFGCIEYLGPSTSEIVADLSKGKEWGQWTQHLYKDQLGSAQRESTSLLRAVLDADADQVSKFCHNYVSSVVWSSWLLGSSDMQEYVQRNSRDSNTVPTMTCSDPDGSSAPHLYQMYNSFSRGTPWKMGVVSARAQKGDILCSVKGLKKTVVVRVYRTPHSESTKLQIYGTARVTERLSESPDPVGGIPDRHMVQIDLKMDARTLFVLLA